KGATFTGEVRGAPHPAAGAATFPPGGETQRTREPYAMAESEWTMPKGDLMRGKKGLVMGIANQNSIAWGIASQLAAQGAEMAFTYRGEGLERRVRPLAEQAGVDTLIPCDVTDDASMDQAFKALEDKFGTLDFVVHSIAFADKNELKGSFVDNTTR